jgi:glutamate racemase
LSQAIGVFDSGVGGLTILSALRRRWPHENFTYLADTARLPYGSKSRQTIHTYARQNVDCLLRYGVKAVVVACNSASAAILEEPLHSTVPLLNVVQPGARKALELSAQKRIGVVGTRATVLSEAYVRAIRQFQPETEVFQQACPLWVPLVEEGWVDDPVTNLIVYRYLTPLIRQQIDTLILGCTHYPALKLAIQKVAGPEVQLIDSSLGLIEDLEKLGICQDTGGTEGTMKMLCTDFSPRLAETFRLLLGDIPYEPIEIINL